MKRILLFIVIVLLLLVSLWFILHNQTSPNKHPLTNDPSLSDQISKTDYRIDSVVGYVLDANKETEINKAKTFVLRGRGASGRVADSKGNIIFEPQSGDGVYAVEPNPRGDLVYIYLGKKSLILNPNNNENIDLPTKPSGPSMLGFGSWNWIDNDVLISASGIQTLDAAGKPLTCCEGHNVEATKLYTYRVSSRTLSEVNLPKFITAKVFTINRVSSDRYLEITTDENQLFNGHKAGWFRIIIPN